MIRVEKDLDVLLGGGLLSRNITHIYGVPASGKTNIALLATYEAAKNGKVAYLDCEGGFSVERMAQICGSDLEKILKNILLIEPTDFDEQKIAFSRLSELMTTEDIRLIVVDSISVLYRLEKERDTKSLGRQIQQLLKLARRHDIPVLMTNQVYSDPDSGRIVPVGGDITRYWSKIMVELERDENTGVRTAILRKHKFLPEGLKLRFRIIDSGIESYGIEHPREVEIENQES